MEEDGGVWGGRQGQGWPGPTNTRGQRVRAKIEGRETGERQEREREESKGRKCRVPVFSKGGEVVELPVGSKSLLLLQLPLHRLFLVWFFAFGKASLSISLRFIL